MKQRNIVREFLVYTFVSARCFLLKGEWQLFIKDIKRFSCWRRTRSQNADSLHTHVPWLAFGAIDYLEQWLTNDMEVFEYGSGSSTLYFSKRAKRVTSVEHNEHWYNSGELQKQKHKIANIQYHFVSPKQISNTTNVCHDPLAY
jgi:hypothetical protein